MNEDLTNLSKQFPWGKYDKEIGIHRLEHHCADVAACFETLVRSPVLRNRLQCAAGDCQLTEVTLARLAVIAFLHDVGKINSGFQFKPFLSRKGSRSRQFGHLLEALYGIQYQKVCDALGLMGMHESWGPALGPLILASLSHHGRPVNLPNQTGTGPSEIWNPRVGYDYDPIAAAKMLRGCVDRWIPVAFHEGPQLPESRTFHHLFAGVVALADQIGSNTEFFESLGTPDPDYMDRARKSAARAVEQLRFRRSSWPAQATSTAFQDLFGHSEPHPIQRAVADAPNDCRLLILESETGSGKTEAAVLRFASLWRNGDIDGIYFAVPTRAAARQLHERVASAISRMIPADLAAETALAVPGYILAGEAIGKPSGNYNVDWDDEPDEAKRLARWAAENARHYLSSFAAVGTVDQVLLAGLKTKWAHLRGSSLTRNLLVVDEAHASDAYMIEILRSVLRGHLACGGHALLMSATLGSSAHAILADVWPGASRRYAASEASEDLPVAKAVPYPALTLVRQEGSTTLAVPPTGDGKSVQIEAVPRIADSGYIAECAMSYAASGAKVLVIRNTVSKAQVVFDACLGIGFPELLLSVRGIPAVHHSRFALEDRQLLDRAVEAVLGKGRPPGGKVVIGTQTLEQSLDIDADVLLTDICPMDVLLQRIGRLHRHANSERPQSFQTPRCRVFSPAEGLGSGLTGGLLEYGLGSSTAGGGIYVNLRSLEATLRLIEKHHTWEIPSMNRMLVEDATHEVALQEIADSLGHEWGEAENRLHGWLAAERNLARMHSLDRIDECFDTELRFLDRDEKVRTRLGDDGPRIELDANVVGPFGIPVRTFNLPSHIFGRGVSLPSADEIEEACAVELDEGLILQVGGHRLRYDRQGIRKSE